MIAFNKGRLRRCSSPQPHYGLSALQQHLQILLRGGDRSNMEILHQIVQHTRRDERRQRGAETDIPDAQIQQRQQDTHRLLLIPREHHRKRQLVHTAAKGVGERQRDLDGAVSVVALADVVGSTSQIINAAKTMDAQTFIVATDKGIFHKMQQAVPGKTLIEAPTAGNSASCKSCAQCPWMAMNSLSNLADVLEKEQNVISVDPEIGEKAIVCIQRMLDFAAERKNRAKDKEATLTSGMGAV